MEKKKLYARFYLNSIGWTKNTRVAPRILSRLTKYSTSKKKSHTERLICHLPIIFYPVTISAPQFFFTYYPNIPISLTSLLTAEQSKDFLYLFPINLFQSLPLKMFVHCAMYLALSLVITAQQNCAQELENLKT